MLRLPDSWVWDCWTADDGTRYHLFFLYASRALHDPERRHYRAAIGHAVSDDLTSWDRVADALVTGDPPAYDDLATWTGCTVRDPAGPWLLFYTGGSTDGGLRAPQHNVQSVGCAESSDLMTWHKRPGPVLRADRRWYERLEDRTWPDEAFRDPWVMPDPGGDGWHMLVTARAATGDPDERGVVGHAWSHGLREWEPRPPLTEPGHGFGHLEVTQAVEVGGRPVLLFSCMAPQLGGSRRGGQGGIWTAPAESLLGPYDIAKASLLTGEELYAGRLTSVRGTDRWVLIAFRNTGPDGRFVGEVADPVPIRWDGDRLVAQP